MKHFIVYGRVQGVGYRAWCAAQANRLGLFGWVRNLSDGCVELVATGEGPALLKLEKKLWKGSVFASVNRVQDLPVAPSLTLDTLGQKREDGFLILDTAESVLQL